RAAARLRPRRRDRQVGAPRRYDAPRGRGEARLPDGGRIRPGGPARADDAPIRGPVRASSDHVGAVSRPPSPDFGARGRVQVGERPRRRGPLRAFPDLARAGTRFATTYWY